MSKETKNTAQGAEFPDDTKVHGGANYEAKTHPTTEGMSPEYRYYDAADDGDNQRPDGVARLCAGDYEVAPDSKTDMPGLKRLRMPMDKWQAKERARQLADYNRQKAAMKPPPELEVLDSCEHKMGSKRIPLPRGD